MKNRTNVVLIKCTINKCHDYRMENSRFCRQHVNNFILHSKEGFQFAKAQTKEEAKSAIFAYIKRVDNE